MNAKLRIKILQKLAQAAPDPSPTDVESSAPPTFSASSSFTNLNQGYEAAAISNINELVSLLNLAIHYSTDGKINFNTLKSSNFSITSSILNTTFKKELFNFINKVYQYLLNKGAAYEAKLLPEKALEITRYLSSSSELNALDKIDFDNKNAKKIPTDLKSKITNFLTMIK